MKYVKRKTLTKKDVKNMDLMQLLKALQRNNEELQALKNSDKEYLDGLCREVFKNV